MAILEARGLCRSYGRVRALDQCDFALFAGEVLAVVGDNGSGKSTLVRCLSGSESPNSGEVAFDGQVVRFRFAEEARTAGIHALYQARKDEGRLSTATQARQSLARVTRRLRSPLDGPPSPDTAVSAGERQRQAMERLAATDCRVAIVDEPASALGGREALPVLRAIEHLRARGVAVVFVSHNLSQVLQVADRVHVQLAGRRAAVVSAQTTSAGDLVAIMNARLVLDECDQALGPVR